MLCQLTGVWTNNQVVLTTDTLGGLYLSATNEQAIPEGLMTVEDAKLHKDGTIKTFFNF